MNVVKITDQTTASQLEAYIGVMNYHAKRAQHIVGTAEFETDWDQCHRKINELLGDWEQRQVMVQSTPQ